MSDDQQLKALSYWNANNYLNIWICNLTDFAGYYPISGFYSTRPGKFLNESLNRWHRHLVHGRLDLPIMETLTLINGLNKGRTATHEVGHFFGLRHIWGDQSNCNGTDYVSDTPPQSSSTSGCPSHPQPQCPSENPRAAMFQNYLDLSDDACHESFYKRPNHSHAHRA